MNQFSVYLSLGFLCLHVPSPSRPPENKMSDVEDHVEEKKQKEKKPGIVYFSRLPPFMKPAKVRHIFSQYGEIGRLFLQPEGTKYFIIRAALFVNNVFESCDASFLF